MIKKISTSLIVILFVSFTCWSQDSTRTKNDKPGTPQSLRTIDNAPVNQVHVSTNPTVPNQSINHGATESNNVNGSINPANQPNQANQTIIVNPNGGNTSTISRTPVTLATKPVGPTNRADSINNNGAMSNGQSNATNPIRK